MTDDCVPPSEPSSSNIRTKSHALLVAAANLAGLGGIAGSILSLAINGLVFWAWGLNFYEIASPSDILMSGVWVSLWLATLIIVLILLSIAPALLVALLDRRIGNYIYESYPRLKTYAFFSGQGIFKATYVIMLTFFAVSAYFLLSCFTGNWLGAWMASAYQAFIMVYAAAPLIYVKFGARRPPNDFVRRRYTVTLVFIAILCGESAFLFAVTKKPSLFVADSQKYQCAGPLGVLWLGTEAVVARCGLDDAPLGRSNRIVVIPRSETILRTRAPV